MKQIILIICMLFSVSVFAQANSSFVQYHNDPIKPTKFLISPNEKPKVNLIIEYPNYTTSIYNCVAIDNIRYQCPVTPQSVINQMGDAYFVNNRLLVCVRHKFSNTHVLDCVDPCPNC